VRIVLDNGAIAPTIDSDTDAGLILYSPKEFVIRAHNSNTIDTGVHIDIPHGYAGFLKSIDGLNKRWSIQCDGVVKADDMNSIVVKLYNHANVPYVIKKGNKIAQLVIVKINTPELELGYNENSND